MRKSKAYFEAIAQDAIQSENWNLLIENGRAYMEYTGRPMSIKEFKKIMGVHITTDHDGKMSGIVSISTSVKLNDECAKHAAIDGAICKYCYANAILDRKKNMNPALEQNFKILNSVIIPVDLWPLLNVRYFRNESFGDLASATCCINYFHCMYRNPETDFGMWTKNYKYVKEAIDAYGYKKPENVQIVISSLFLNVQLNIKLYKYADKIFTVYSDEAAAAAAGVTINCGKRSCLKCTRCYKADTEIYINELLK